MKMFKVLPLVAFLFSAAIAVAEVPPPPVGVEVTCAMANAGSKNDCNLCCDGQRVDYEADCNYSIDNDNSCGPGQCLQERLDCADMRSTTCSSQCSAL